jgi:hypothetical protein
MTETASEAPIDNLSDEEPEEALPTPTPEDEGQTAPAKAPQVTFRGNSYDLISLGSLVTGGLILFSCVTCGTGYYCMPVIAVILGAIGVLGARQAVDGDRTRLWSWLGIAAGGILFLLIAAAFVLYIAFIILAVTSSSGPWD